MAVSEVPLKIHVAKAKDLPLSWYELVLRPDKFAGHLEVLRENKKIAPTAPNLMITFLDKAGIYSILSNPSLSFSDLITGEKEGKLVKCALLVASLLQWDFTSCGDELPLSVQYCLVSLLRGEYPAPEVGVVDTEGAAAHAIFSGWVLKFVIHECHAPSVQPRPPVQTWDSTCALTLTDQIKDMVKQYSEGSVSYLTEFLDAVQRLADKEVPAHWPVPCVCVDLPVLSGAQGAGEVYLEPFPRGEGPRTPFRQRLCGLEFTLGCYHFVVGQCDRALRHLRRARQLLSGCRGQCQGVEEEQLAGFLRACEGVVGGGADEREGAPLPAQALELHLQSQDYESAVEVLVRDMGRCTLPSELLTSLERQVPHETEGAEPKPKRQKLDSVAAGSAAVSLRDKVTICSALRRVLEGFPPPPHLWGLLASGNSLRHMEFILLLCEEVLKCEVTSLKKLRLQTFVRSVCSGVHGGTDAWNQLLSSPVASHLTLTQDSTSYKHFLAAETPVGDVGRGHAPSSVEHLERAVAQALSPQQVAEGVEQLFQATPTAQHRTLAAKWTGSSRGYSPVEGVTDLVTVTKYNILMHRAKSLGQNQCYDKSVQLYRAAQQLLGSSVSLFPAKLHPQLRDHLEEQLLVTEVMMVQRGSAHLGAGPLPQRHAALMARAKSYYTNSHSWTGSDAPALYVVTAFLLNTQELSFLFQYASHHSCTTPVVPPRLAEAVVDVRERRDLRKCTRSLFEAVVCVFSPLPHGNEGKTEVNERQSKLRANIDLFIRNLTDRTALSLLAAALARIWNLLKKPEEDILTEFSSHWPTAIGNAANIDAGHVLRMLNATLSHALRLFPQSSSWLIIKANLHSAVCEHGAALENYMEAGALTSAHFHHEVPDEVWSQPTLRQLVRCCCRLGYYTQAVLLCQLLHPVDYELAFGIMKENASHMTEGMFQYFWDMSIIEYLIYVHSKKADCHKQTAAMQVAGQTDLNFNNSLEVLGRAAQVRRRRFLRAFYTLITNTI